MAPNGVIKMEDKNIVDPPKKGFYTVPASIINAFIKENSLSLPKPK